MRFTRFTLMQDGHAIGDFTGKELAVSTARQHAMDTGRPVSVVGHVDGGAREAIFTPDGTIEWDHSIDGRFEDTKEEEPT